MNKFPETSEPLNSQERMIYAQTMRLDALCTMMSDFIEAYAKVNNLGVEEVKVVEQMPKKKVVAKPKEGQATKPRKPRAVVTKVEEVKE